MIFCAGSSQSAGWALIMVKHTYGEYSGGPIGVIPSGVKVFLASHSIDFHKWPNGLLSLVRDAGSDPYNGARCVFGAKRTGSRSCGGMVPGFSSMPSGWRKCSFVGNYRPQPGRRHHAQLSLWSMEWTGRGFVSRQ